MALCNVTVYYSDNAPFHLPLFTRLFLTVHITLTKEIRK